MHFQYIAPAEASPTPMPMDCATARPTAASTGSQYAFTALIAVVAVLAALFLLSLLVIIFLVMCVARLNKQKRAMAGMHESCVSMPCLWMDYLISPVHVPSLQFKAKNKPSFHLSLPTSLWMISWKAQLLSQAQHFCDIGSSIFTQPIYTYASTVQCSCILILCMIHYAWHIIVHIYYCFIL